MNTSISIPVFSFIVLTSSIEHSLARTILSTPNSFQYNAASELLTDACVDKWIGIPNSLHFLTTARSQQITASILASFIIFIEIDDYHL